MKSNVQAVRNLRRNDEAVSPVIAVILMVAITVVLAATVYVWVSGFGASGEQAPAASFKITNCDDDDDDAGHNDESVTVKLLSSSKSLDPTDLRFVITAESDGSGTTDGFYASSNSTWDVGTSKTIGDAGTGGNDDLTDGTTYIIDIVHDPSGNVIGSPQFTC